MIGQTQEKKQIASASRQNPRKLGLSKKRPSLTSNASSRKRKGTEDAVQTELKKIRKPTTERLVSKTKKALDITEIDNNISKNKKTAADKSILPKACIGRVHLDSSQENLGFSEKASDLEDLSKSSFSGFHSDEYNGDLQSEKGSDLEDLSKSSFSGFHSDEDDGDLKSEKEVYFDQVKHPLKKQALNSKNIAEKKVISEKPGVIYIGRIPHGFYEHEMKDYFKQFGTILKLRLSRNKKTGASKHRAWIQFESASVSEIVAKTMDNYLMFGHLLKVKTVPDDQIPKNLFKNANKRFKKVPWNKMEGRKLKQALPQDTWQRRINKEEKRRLDKASKLKDLGYEFESPKIKCVKDITRIEP